MRFRYKNLKNISATNTKKYNPQFCTEAAIHFYQILGCTNTVTNVTNCN